MPTKGQKRYHIKQGHIKLGIVYAKDKTEARKKAISNKKINTSNYPNFEIIEH